MTRNATRQRSLRSVIKAILWLGLFSSLASVLFASKSRWFDIRGLVSHLTRSWQDLRQRVSL